MFNKVVMLGRLTRDIELRYTPNGMAVGKTAIATNRKFKSKTGEVKEETCFVDITFFGRGAEIANQYLHKGSLILIEGRLIYEQWTDQHGNKRSKHSIAVDNMQMIGGKEEGNTNTNQTQNSNQYANNPSNNQNNINQQQNLSQKTQEEIPEIDIEDDEIPF